MAKRKSKKAQHNKPKVLGIILFLVALLLIVSLISHRYVDDYRITGEDNSDISPFETEYKNQGGMLGAYLSYFVLTLFGWLGFFIPFGLIIYSLRLFTSEIAEKLKLNSFILFLISLLATMLYNIHLLTARQLGVEQTTGGGWVTENLTILFIKIAGETGSYIIFGGIIAILLVVYTSITPILSARISLPKLDSFSNLFKGFGRLFKRLFTFKWLISFFEGKDENDDGLYEEPPQDYVTDEVEPAVQKRKRSSDHVEPVKTTKIVRRTPEKTETVRPIQLESISYEYPKLDLLTENPHTESSVSKDELDFTAKMLEETLDTFGVHIEGKIDYYPGPIITRYEFKPGTGIKINQIVNLSDDLALALKAKRIRIIAPIPGKAAVGVEIPNRNTQIVYLRDILETNEFKDSRHTLPLALGKTTSGKPFIADLAKMPHVLVAGATGSGKSVGMNVMITSLLYRLHPHQVRFIFIDPKMLELSVYAGIPHLGRPVVTKPKRAEKVLSDAVIEMESRYRKLANASVRNIADYNKKQTEEEKKLPYIVICVDELADLMMSATSSKIEMLITRLAQMSRAVGIHLILATQRPSVDVITGLIKANFPSRIAFQVSTKVDSRTIIDGNGAEKLLGNGDMLFLETGQPESMRIHGAFLSSEETESIVSFINEQKIEMMTLDSISQTEGEPTSAEIDFGDPLFKEACEVVIRHKQGSVSLLQRRLGIGYQRAARLIDKLEQAGIVTAFDGSKARDVLVDKTYLETLFANAPGNQSPSLFDSEKN